MTKPSPLLVGLALALCIGVTASAAATVTQPWSMRGRDTKHVGRASVAGPPTSKVKWQFASGPVWSSPAVAFGTIYVGSGDCGLYALNADGTKKWRFPTGGLVYSSPAVGPDGTIYVGSDDHNLYAVNPNGTKKWSFETGGWVWSSPAIGADGTIYFGSGDSKLYALNPDGTKKWTFQAGGLIYSSPAIGSDGVIYFGSDDGRVYAVSPSGSKLWLFATGGPVWSSPAIAGGAIYVGSSDHKLYALYPNGTKKWAYTTGGAVWSSPAIGADGTVYIGSGDGSLYAVTYGGAKKWSFATGEELRYSSPAIDSVGTVLITAGAKLFAVKPDGTKKWEASAGSWGLTCSSPAIGADGTIYFGSDDGNVYALNRNLSRLTASTGALINYGTSYAVTGTLKDPNWQPLAGRTITVQSLEGSTWTNVATGVTDAAGAYRISITPQVTKTYRSQFAGDSQYLPSVSGTTTKVTVRPYVSTPTAASTPKANVPVAFSGFLKPQHTAGAQDIDMQFSRLVSGVWYYKYTVKSTNADHDDYTQFSGNVTFLQPGTWKVRAFHAADSLNGDAYSPEAIFTVNE